MKRSIGDQVIVITGASSGIGLATAAEAARRGARVVMAARNAADLERRAEEIRRDGGTAIAVPTDVTELGQVESLASRAAAEWGRIDTWVNNAGVSHYATFKEASMEDFRQVMEVNFMGQVHGARAALPYLEQTAGALVCVGSTLSDRGVPLQGAYCASKHALKGWLDSLRVELRKEGSRVRVTLIKPSSINTPLFEKAKTQMGVKPMPIPPIYDARLGAEAILRAAEGNERDIFVGGAGKVMSVGERLSPKLVDVQQLWQGFESQKTATPRKATAPSNLYSPVERDGGVEGEFTARASGRSIYQNVAAHSVGAPLAAAAGLIVGSLLVHRSGARGGSPLLLGMGALLLAGKSATAAFVQR